MTGLFSSGNFLRFLNSFDTTVSTTESRVKVHKLHNVEEVPYSRTRNFSDESYTLIPAYVLSSENCTSLESNPTNVEGYCLIVSGPPSFLP